MSYGTPNSDPPTSGNPYQSRPDAPPYPPNWGSAPYPGTAPGPNTTPGYGSAAPQPGANPYGGYSYGSPYPGPMAPATSGWAIASIVCSIAGWLGFAVVGQLLGVIFGHMALREIAASGGRLEGRGIAMAGLIIGYIGFGLLVLALLFVVVLFLIVGISSSPQGSLGMMLSLLP